MTLRNYRVDILTKDVGILAPETTGRRGKPFRRRGWS